VDPGQVVMGPTDPATVAAALDRLTTGPHPVTALLTGNNRITLEVLRRLPLLTYRPALVGFDDLELAELLVPGLTVVAQDPAGLGRTAADLLFRRLDGDTGPLRTVRLPTRLIPRGSGETAVP
jgi:LacI family transcriptional regulator